MHHAYDRGIRFFETAESYAGMQEMLAIALKGIPRENYRLMTKVTTGDGNDPQTKIDELRRAAQTDYFDIMLLHCAAHGHVARRNHAVAGRNSAGRAQADSAHATAPSCTVFPRCARCRATSGWRSP